MIEIDTKLWTPVMFWAVVDWCAQSFGACNFGVSWYLKNDYSLYMSEKNLTWFLLRWA